MEPVVGRGIPKLLKGWSGGRGSNPRRPAWEIEPKLKIQNMESMTLISGDYNSPSFKGLLQTSR